MTDKLDLEELKGRLNRLANARPYDREALFNALVLDAPDLIEEVKRLRSMAWWLAKMGTGAGCLISECTYRDSENCDCGILYRKAELESTHD